MTTVAHRLPDQELKRIREQNKSSPLIRRQGYPNMAVYDRNRLLGHIDAQDEEATLTRRLLAECALVLLEEPPKYPQLTGKLIDYLGYDPDTAEGKEAIDFIAEIVGREVLCG